MKKPIQVWEFYDAPEELQALSTHGGDEDWLAVVPKEYVSTYIPWIESASFGCAGVSEHTLADGSVVFIGAHA